jgi:hypothetical protein
VEAQTFYPGSTQQKILAVKIRLPEKQAKKRWLFVKPEEFSFAARGVTEGAMLDIIEKAELDEKRPGKMTAAR